MKPRDLDIKDVEFIQFLDEIKDEFYKLKEEHGLYMEPKGAFNGAHSEDERSKTNPEYFVSEEYLKIQQDKGLLHTGFPEDYFAYPTSRLKKSNNAWEDLLGKMKGELSTMVGGHHSSLASYYEPGGFVGWHTNWNNSNYQILFTWSETGDSYFTYVDIETKEICKIQERPGWQMHLVYFGSKKEMDKVFWHGAYTNCDRFALAISWSNGGYGSERDATVRMMVEELIKDLTDDY